jgi:superfamily II DNA helicase RecQ
LTAPEGRCCDVCDPESWLPDPETLDARPGRRKAAKAAPEIELSAEDGVLFETLRRWRQIAAKGKPAYTVANNRTLEEIAASKPGDVESLAEIHGIGPAFIKRHADEVLDLLARHS